MRDEKWWELGGCLIPILLLIIASGGGLAAEGELGWYGWVFWPAVAALGYICWGVATNRE